MSRAHSRPRRALAEREVKECVVKCEACCEEAGSMGPPQMGYTEVVSCSRA